MKFIVLAILLVCSFALDDSRARFLFEEFRAQNNKLYVDGYEAQIRYAIFKHNIEWAIERNQKHPEARMGITQFADMTNEEFKAYVEMSHFEAGPIVNVEAPVAVNAPDKWDWVKEGAYVNAKNQGQCGSCWAFGAVGALEGLAYTVDKKVHDFSEQQLVDCAKECHACQGGLRDKAFDYVIKAGGICLQKDYPYTARGETCKDSQCTKVFKISSYGTITPGNSIELRDTVYKQPVSVGVEASGRAFQMYRGGIVTEGCSQAINHGVVAVGYGEENSTKYWNIRNSWGATWGEKGYIRLLRSENTSGQSMCAVATRCYYPKV